MEGKCPKCGEKGDIFVNLDEYQAFECLPCRLAYRIMANGDLQIIKGYKGPGLEDFDLITDSEEIRKIIEK